MASLAVWRDERGVRVVRVIYSDESGTGNEKEEPIAVIAALMLNMDSQWIPVRDLVDTSFQEYLGDRDLERNEIKGNQLYKEIRKGSKRAARLMRKLMAVTRVCRVPVFYGAVDRLGYKAIMDDSRPTRGSDDFFTVAFTDCLNRVETYIHTAMPEEQVLWIHDAGGKGTREAKDTLRTIRDMRDDDFADVFDASPESYVADMIYFGDSAESRLLQLADVCCSTIVRHLRGDPIAAPFYKVLRPQVQNDGTEPSFYGAQEMLKEIEKRRKAARESGKR
jgi:hypothetical protein